MDEPKSDKPSLLPMLITHVTADMPRVTGPGMASADVVIEAVRMRMSIM